MTFRHSLLVPLLTIGLGPVASSSALAQTLVQAIDADTLRVISYQGKPPYKRVTIDRASDPALYDHYAGLIAYDPQPLQLVQRRGAPGKSTSRQVRMVGDAQETAEFARFEESSDPGADSNNRRWRGAPGKSRPLDR